MSRGVERDARWWAARVAVVVVLVVWLGLVVRLAALERGGPPHVDLSLGEGIPATLYLPGEREDGRFPVQRSPGERPPVVVIAHGYSADRMIMSPFARSLAEAGYAALTFDFRGHGSNTRAFQGLLRDDLTDVLDWVESSPLVDGSRVAVLGHSMGAGAALDFATLDPRPMAVIPVSGGSVANDERTPDHVLFLVAAGDPTDIHDRQRELADLLDDRAEVTSVEVGGTDHLTILWSGTAVDAVLDLLDGPMGVERAPGDATGMQDPRLRAAALYLVVAVILVGLLGLVLAPFVGPAGSTWTADASPGGLLLVAVSLVVATPLMASAGAGILPLGPGQAVITLFLLAGAALWGARVAVGRGVLAGPAARWVGDAGWLPLRAVAVPGVLAGLGVIGLLLPVAPVFHRFLPTPERLVYWVVLAVAALPFFAAFHGLLRRGGTWAALGLGLAGRALLVLAIYAGVAVGVLPGVLGLVLPLLVLQFLLLELLAATCYARARNPAVLAVVDSVFVAWMAVTLTPVG